MRSRQEYEKMKTLIGDSINVNIPISILDDIIEYIQKNYAPDEIFSDKDMMEWARDTKVKDRL